MAADPARLKKAQLKHYLALRYGAPMAEKLQSIFDFTQSLPVERFREECEKLLSTRNHLLQIAFDIFDADLDDRISELDLFKVFYQFNQGQNANQFSSIFHEDMCQIILALQGKWKHKYDKIVRENESDEQYVQRLL